MAKKNGFDHADVMRQAKYPMPGTDLGSTTAIPFNEAVDVDQPGGCERFYDKGMHGRGDMYSNKSFVMGDRPETLIPAANPTRQRK
jgi:hypothetical protein